jgi:hypothetical protein
VVGEDDGTDDPGDTGDGTSRPSNLASGESGVDGTIDSAAVAYDTYELARDSALNGAGSAGGGLKADGGPADGTTGVVDAPAGGEGGAASVLVGSPALDVRSSSITGDDSTAGEFDSVLSSTGADPLSPIELDDDADASLPVRACCAAAGPPSGDARITLSKSGGGTLRSARDVDAANAIACAPYGTPNRPRLSRLEMSRICSGVGPERG